MNFIEEHPILTGVAVLGVGYILFTAVNNVTRPAPAPAAGLSSFGGGGGGGIGIGGLVSGVTGVAGDIVSGLGSVAGGILGGFGL